MRKKHMSSNAFFRYIIMKTRKKKHYKLLYNNAFLNT